MFSICESRKFARVRRNDNPASLLFVGKCRSPSRSPSGYFQHVKITMCCIQISNDYLISIYPSHDDIYDKRSDNNDDGGRKLETAKEESLEDGCSSNRKIEIR